MDYSIKGIPNEYSSFSVESFYELVKEKQDALKYKSCQEKIEKWINQDEFSFGLFLGGPSGSGKTFWGSFIVIRLLEKRITARRLVLADVIRDYYSDSSSWKVPDIVFADEVLFIDDFGKGIDGSDKKQVHVDKIVSACLKYRHEKGLATILAASEVNNNLSGESIEMLKDFLYPIPFPNCNLKKVAMAKKMREF